ncbi:MAG: DUF916 domain-containing protein [Patescibacteria group bacterium]
MLKPQHLIKHITLCALFLFLFSGSYVFSMGNGSIAISPPVADVNPSEPLTKGWIIESLNPGQEVQRKVTVTNSTSEEKRVILAPEDYYPGDQGAYSYTDKEELQNVGTWIKLDKTEFTIPAKQSEDVPFTITVPDNLSPGEYSGVIALQEAVSSPRVGTISFVSRVSTRIYVTVPGKLESGIKFNNFQFVTPNPDYTDSDKYTQFLRANYNLSPENIFVGLNLINNGNIFNKIRGNIQITNPEGEIGEYSFNRDLGPGSNQVEVPYLMTDINWSSPGLYKAKYTFTNEPLIAFNKDDVRNTSESQVVETEVELTQDQLDQFKLDLDAAKAIVDNPSSDQSIESILEVQQIQSDNESKMNPELSDEKIEDQSNKTIYWVGGILIFALSSLTIYLLYNNRKLKNTKQDKIKKDNKLDKKD